MRPKMVTLVKVRGQRRPDGTWAVYEPKVNSNMDAMLPVDECIALLRAVSKRIGEQDDMRERSRAASAGASSGPAGVVFEATEGGRRTDSDSGYR